MFILHRGTPVLHNLFVLSYYKIYNVAPTLFLFIYYILIEVKDILPIKQFLILALSIVPILLMVHFGPHATRVNYKWGFLDGWAVLQLGYGVGVRMISKGLLDSRVRSWQL